MGDIIQLYEMIKELEERVEALEGNIDIEDDDFEDENQSAEEISEEKLKDEL